MTGFGLGETPLAEGRLLLEVRALNHRFLEIRLTLSPELAPHAAYFEQLARDRLKRGRYAMGARLLGSSGEGAGIDLGRARAAYLALCALRDELAPGTELPVTAIASLPGLLCAAPCLDDEQARAALRAALLQALAALDAMRAAEGTALGRDLRGHLGEARRLCAGMAEHALPLVETCRKRLRERVAQLLRDTAIAADQGRLEMEIALFADRSDVSEELARLGSHFDQFELLLEGNEPVGRTMDFLLQEMAREANTIGAKSQDACLAQRVVELKVLLERLREQVQNVE